MAKILEALTGLIRALNEVFGPTGTAVTMVVLALGAIGWYLWSQRRKQKALDRILQGYDALIEELETQLRGYRAQELAQRLGVNYQKALALVDETYPKHSGLLRP